MADVKSQIKTLLNIAANDAASEAEIDNALAIAARMMARHHLSEEDLIDDPLKQQQDAINAPKTKQDVYNNTNVSTWEGMLAGTVVKIVGGVGYYHRQKHYKTTPAGIICRDQAGKAIKSGSIVFYGSEEDVALSIRLYNEVRTAVIALAHMKYGGAFRGDGCAYAEGFVDGLRKKEQDRRLAEEDEARRDIAGGNGSTGMILIQRRNDLISKKETAARNWLASPAGGGIKLSMSSRSGSGASRDARGEGRSDGSRYNASAARLKKLT